MNSAILLKTFPHRGSQIVFVYNYLSKNEPIWINFVIKLKIKLWTLR